VDEATAPARGTRGERFGSRRQIGPIGASARIVGGVAAIALPSALDGFGWWDAAVALLALPLIAAVAAALIVAALRRLAPGSLASRHAICSPADCGLIAVVILVNDAVAALTPANSTVTIWVWLGASMLLAAARGYGGCEVLAVSNLISGRSEQIGCILYTPIDRFEAARKANKIATSRLRT
jgi:hypothetical protein